MNKRTARKMLQRDPPEKRKRVLLPIHLSSEMQEQLNELVELDAVINGDAAKGAYAWAGAFVREGLRVTLPEARKEAQIVRNVQAATGKELHNEQADTQGDGVPY